jgi:Spy/CpxP family protein refolding chaperone
MIRFTWILTVFALAAVSGHFGYLHLAAAPAPAGTPTSGRTELIWLQRELDLTPSQLTTVRALHEECWTRVAKLRVQLDAERRNARATGNPAACVAAEEQCKSCTVTFIQQMTTVLTPAQRQKYLGLVGSCLPPAPRTEGVNVEQSPGR